MLRFFQSGNRSIHNLTQRSTNWNQRVQVDEYLSTHDLTQRSTVVGLPEIHIESLSTHDLTQRSTKPVRCDVLVNHLSTHDLTQRSTNPGFNYFLNTNFQLTTSRRGRLVPVSKRNPEKGSFNSRPHAEVDHKQFSGKYICVSFNSRPHAEVDAMCFPPYLFFDLSTHDLTQRSTASRKQAGHSSASFQLTTSRRGRPYAIGITDVDSILSTHDLTQRSTRRFLDAEESQILSTHDLTQRSTAKQQSAKMPIFLSTHDLTQRSTVVPL